MTRAAVSQHLSVLEKAALVTRVRRGRWIECQISPEGLRSTAMWLEQQRSEWEDRLDRLEAHLNREAPQEGPHD